MRLFLSYAQPDQDLRDRLIQHLSLLKRERILDTWDISEITAGTEREPAIAQQIDQAEIILLLISAAFIASGRYDVEMKRAIERHKNRQARVIPILLKPCDWESAPFAELEVLPKGGKPVTAGDIETALSTIAQEIRRVAVELNPALAKPRKSVMKLGAPLPGVRLPENFVERPEALNAVKALLLEESEKPLVVSAIAGLGGLGKSVLATALVLDAEVQERFEDGILWVTLGQNPDLQSLLGDWIRTLDKSRESYSATTLEAASRYLQTLLIEKRMLLVVDDVWIGAHVEHFRVGGAECRMLVTTREAQIEGAEVHALDLMSEEEAIALVRQKLNRQWNPAQESEVKAFAKSLGYLPLALDLAANQVRDGLSWGELRSEFETERRAVALEVLDSSEAWETLDEKEQRKYSLRACFNLSLRRLSAEQLRQFAWLGVLPEDVSLDVRMAMTLWELPRVQAKKVLVLLKNRSFLTSGTETLEGEPTFRVHDLMHDTARGLLEQDALSDPLRSLLTPIQNLKSKIQNLASAHAQLLERYRLQAEGHWDRLPNDRYIHWHLTWHLQQAGMEDEIHTLIAMSDEHGRNAWFEACDRIGQPTIFVQDVKRAWAISEQSYEKNNTKSIAFQCRYALITATLNSLSSQLPAGLMAEFVKRGYWTPEQTWAYVEQMQNEEKIAEVIQALAAYLPKAIFTLAKEKARLINSKYNQALALTALTRVDHTIFPETLAVAQTIQDGYCCAFVIRNLAQLDIKADYFEQLFATVQLIPTSEYREWALDALQQMNSNSPDIAASSSQSQAHYSNQDTTNFAQKLKSVRNIPLRYKRTQELNILARSSDANFLQLLEVARALQDEYEYAKALCVIAENDKTYLSKAVEVAQTIQDIETRASVLCTLAQIDSACFLEALRVAQMIEDESRQALILRVLGQANSTDFAQFLKVTQRLRNKAQRALVLSSMTQGAFDLTTFLKAVRAVQDETWRAEIFGILAQYDLAYFPEALESAQAIQDTFLRALELCTLAQVNSAYFSEALETAQATPDNFSRVWALTAIGNTSLTNLAKLFEITRTLQDEAEFSEMINALAQVKSSNFDYLLQAALQIENQSESVEDESVFAEDNLSLVGIVRTLAETSVIDFPEEFEVVPEIQPERSRVVAMRQLIQIDPIDFKQLFETARVIQSNSKSGEHDLPKVSSDDFNQVLEMAKSAHNDLRCAAVLTNVAQTLPEELLSQVLGIIDGISHKATHAYALSAYLFRLPLVSLSLSDWQTYLHLLAHRTRADLMQDLAKLYPAIVHLGGKEAVRGMVDAMREVCQQWK